MNDLEKELDQCNIWLYKILTTVADIKFELKEKQLEELNEDILINKLLSGEIKI